MWVINTFHLYIFNRHDTHESLYKHFKFKYKTQTITNIFHNSIWNDINEFNSRENNSSVEIIILSHIKKQKAKKSNEKGSIKWEGMFYIHNSLINQSILHFLTSEFIDNAVESFFPPIHFYNTNTIHHFWEYFYLLVTLLWI